MSTRIAVLALLAVTLTAALAPPASAAATPRASLTDIENDVMCTSCREPLALAQSPQAVEERAFIVGLIAQGHTKAQIEHALISEYGLAVLGRPPAHGFNLTIYILPPAVLVAGRVTLAVALPRWRRRARREAADQPAPPEHPLLAADARRLEEDLARYN